MEIFSSIQGEGSYLGEPQIFVRFARCPLRCLYCDTPGSWVVRSQFRVFGEHGVGLFSNPATVSGILKQIRGLEKEGGRKLTVSLTGGEPLLYPDFIYELSKQLRKEGRRVHLETAGVQPRALERVLSQIDHVSMDWKLPSTLERGDFTEIQKQFLKQALKMKQRDLVVKIVLTNEIPRKEFEEAIQDISQVDSKVAVVLQPVTPKRKVRQRISSVKLREFSQIASRYLQTIRVLPQLHPLLRLK